MKNISLDEFLAKELANLHRFKQQWEENHLAYPDDFPMELLPAEWNEQYMIWED